jgi:hypothetical protein
MAPYALRSLLLTVAWPLLRLRQRPLILNAIIKVTMTTIQPIAKARATQLGLKIAIGTNTAI